MKLWEFMQVCKTNLISLREGGAEIKISSKDSTNIGCQAMLIGTNHRHNLRNKETIPKHEC